MPRLSKMEACAALVAIRSSLERHLQFEKRRLEDPAEKKDPGAAAYVKEQIEITERQIQAIEMAGRSMTR